MFRKSGVVMILWLAAFAMSGSAYPSLTAAQEEGNPWWLWIIVFLVLAGFVVFMLWWWLRGAAEEEGIAPARHAQVKQATSSPPLEVVPPDPVPDQPTHEDDLKRIEGIGPKISGVLKEAGIRSFGQLAATDAEALRQLLQEADPNLPRLADPTTWPSQAGLAAEGRWEELKALQAELKGGRRR
jgi:predicted flap endonuclease-1-like 5' DNA nuclease